MKIVMTGSEGYVGQELLRRGIEPLKCDILKPLEIGDALELAGHPDTSLIIIHLAALTDVDYCEEHRMEAFNVNVRGVSNLVDNLTSQDVIIYVSTDHVFDGRKYWAYSEKQDPHPINVYGLTKWAGEAISTYGVAKSIVVRSSKLFSWSTMQEDVNNLLLGKPKEYTTLIKRSFLHVRHFVDGLLFLANNIEDTPSIVNISNNETMNYYEFWSMASQVFGLDESLIIPRSREIQASPRPMRTGLNCELARSLGIPIYSTYEGLKLANEERLAK